MVEAEDTKTVRVWCGNVALSRSDQALGAASRLGRRCVDSHVREQEFLRGLAEVRLDAAGHVSALLDELEHRWLYSGAPAGLYVLTAKAAASAGWMLHAGGKIIGASAVVTKLGQAERSLAARIVRYLEEGIKDLATTNVRLRVAVYGRRPAMISEAALTAVAREAGARRLELWNSDSVRHRSVTSRSF